MLGKLPKILLVGIYSRRSPSSPGCFFAANELKIMMAYVVANYDVKFEREGVRPKNVHVALTISPDPEARVLFKERKSARI